MLAVTGQDPDAAALVAETLRARAARRRLERRAGWRSLRVLRWGNSLEDIGSRGHETPGLIEAARRVADFGFAVKPFDDLIDLARDAHIRRLAQREFLSAGGLRVEALSTRAPRDQTYGGALWSVEPTFVGTVAGLTRLADEVLDRYVLQLDRATSVARLAPGSWGALFPRVALVGEGPPDAETLSTLGPDRPFAQLGGCSATLSSLLTIAQLDEQHVRLFNARSAGGAEITAAALAWCGARKYVALGRVAHERLVSLGVTHAELPHPQYLRRFESRNLAKWGARLREAVNE